MFDLLLPNSESWLREMAPLTISFIFCDAFLFALSLGFSSHFRYILGWGDPLPFFFASWHCSIPVSGWQISVRSNKFILEIGNKLYIGNIHWKTKKNGKILGCIGITKIKSRKYKNLNKSINPWKKDSHKYLSTCRFPELNPFTTVF